MPAQTSTLSVPQTANMLAVSEATVRRYCRDGTLSANMVTAAGKQDYWAIDRKSCEQVSQARRASGAAIAARDHEATSLMSASEHFAAIVRGLLADQQKALAPPAEELAARAQAQDHRDELLEQMNDRLADHPQLHDLIGQLAAARRDLAARDREIARLEEELAAERRTTWWQRLISAVWRGRSPDRPTY